MTDLRTEMTQTGQVKEQIQNGWCREPVPIHTTSNRGSRFSLLVL